MNYDLGHPDFLGIYEVNTLSGFVGLDKEEDEKVSDALSWQSIAGQETEAATYDPHDWSTYGVGPDGIPGTLDDVNGPRDVDSLMDWFDNWFLPYMNNNSGSAFMSALTGRNTITNMSGMMKPPMSADSLWLRFFYGWKFGILYWDEWASFEQTYGDMYPP